MKLGFHHPRKKMKERFAGWDCNRQAARSCNNHYQFPRNTLLSKTTCVATMNYRVSTRPTHRSSQTCIPTGSSMGKTMSGSRWLYQTCFPTRTRVFDVNYRVSPRSTHGQVCQSCIPTGSLMTPTTRDMKVHEMYTQCLVLLNRVSFKFVWVCHNIDGFYSKQTVPCVSSWVYCHGLFVKFPIPSQRGGWLETPRVTQFCGS